MLTGKALALGQTLPSLLGPSTMALYILSQAPGRGLSGETLPMST